MSEKFFNIGKNIFNKDMILSICETTEKVEVEQSVVIVTYLAGHSEKISLQGGEKLADILTAKDINFP